MVYVIARSWTKSVVGVKTVAKDKYAVKSVQLLGSNAKLNWEQSNEALNIAMPKELSNTIPVYVFKVIL